MWKGNLGDELVEEGCGAVRGCAAGDEGGRSTLRHRVVSREVLDGLVGSDVDEEGVDLDEVRPGLIGFMPLGRRSGVALADDAQAAWTGLLRARHARYDASRHELRQDAPDHRDRDVDPLPAQEDGELALPHIG